MTFKRRLVWDPVIGTTCIDTVCINPRSGTAGCSTEAEVLINDLPGSPNISHPEVYYKE